MSFLDQCFEMKLFTMHFNLSQTLSQQGGFHCINASQNPSVENCLYKSAFDLYEIKSLVSRCSHTGILLQSHFHLPHLSEV